MKPQVLTTYLHMAAIAVCVIGFILTQTLSFSENFDDMENRYRQEMIDRHYNQNLDIIQQQQQQHQPQQHQQPPRQPHHIPSIYGPNNNPQNNIQWESGTEIDIDKKAVKTIGFAILGYVLLMLAIGNVIALILHKSLGQSKYKISYIILTVLFVLMGNLPMSIYVMAGSVTAVKSVKTQDNSIKVIMAFFLMSGILSVAAVLMYFYSFFLNVSK